MKDENIKDYIIKKCKKETNDDIETNNLAIMCLFEIYQHEFFKNEYEQLSLIHFKKDNSLKLYHPSLNNRLGAVNRTLPSTLFSYQERLNHSYILSHPLRDNSNNFLSNHEADSLNFNIILNEKNYQNIKKYKNIIENSYNINNYIIEFSKLLKKSPQLINILKSYVSGREQKSLHKDYINIIQTDLLKSDFFDQVLDIINQYQINYKDKISIYKIEQPDKETDFLLKQPIIIKHIEKNNIGLKTIIDNRLKKKNVDKLDQNTFLEIYNDFVFYNKAAKTLNQINILTQKKPDDLPVNIKKVKKIVDETIKYFKLNKKLTPYIVIDRFDDNSDDQTNEDILRKHSLNITGIYGTNSKQGIFDNQLLCDGSNTFNFNKRISYKKGYIITIRNDLENIASALVLSDSNVIKLDKPINKTDDIHYMFVSDKYKNQGYGRKLIKTIAKLSKEQKRHLSIAYTGDRNNAYFIQNIMNNLNQLNEINPIYYCEAPRDNLSKILEEKILDKYVKNHNTLKEAYVEMIFQYKDKADFNKNMLIHISPENYDISEYNNLYDVLKTEYKKNLNQNIKIKDTIKSKEHFKQFIENNTYKFSFFNPAVFFETQAPNIIRKFEAETQKENLEKNINNSKIQSRVKML